MALQIYGKNPPYTYIRPLHLYSYPNQIPGTTDYWHNIFLALKMVAGCTYQCAVSNRLNHLKHTFLSNRPSVDVKHTVCGLWILWMHYTIYNELFLKGLWTYFERYRVRMWSNFQGKGLRCDVFFNVQGCRHDVFSQGTGFCNVVISWEAASGWTKSVTRQVYNLSKLLRRKNQA